MPEDKICPFRYISPYTTVHKCFKSKCELWSTQLGMCSIVLGMHAILSVADSIRGLSENLKSLDSYQF